MVLTPTVRKFVLHWGEMGARWGINRTEAQIHALLYLSPEPLNAEQIARALSVARSNVSNSLKELQNWGVIRVAHRIGDRRDYFESLHDVWEMFQIILDERKRREIDPTMVVLRECATAARADARGKPSVEAERLERMLGFFETMTTWYRQIRSLPTGAMIRIVKLGGRLPKKLGLSV